MRKIERELKIKNTGRKFDSLIIDKSYFYCAQKEFKFNEKYDLIKVVNKILQKVKDFDQYFNIKITTDDNKVYTIINNNQFKFTETIKSAKNINFDDSKIYFITLFQNNGDSGTIQISKWSRNDNYLILYPDRLEEGLRYICKTVKYKWIDNHVDIKED